MYVTAWFETDGKCTVFPLERPVGVCNSSCALKDYSRLLWIAETKRGYHTLKLPLLPYICYTVNTQRRRRNFCCIAVFGPRNCERLCSSKLGCEAGETCEHHPTSVLLCQCRASRFKRCQVSTSPLATIDCGHLQTDE